MKKQKKQKNWNIFSRNKWKVPTRKVAQPVDSCTLENTGMGITSWLRVRNTEPGTK